MGWQPSWGSVAEWGATASVVLGVWWKLARKDGQQGRDIENMKAKLEDHETRLKTHTTQLSEGDGNFRVIDSKLDNIMKGQDETHKLLLDHIIKEGKNGND